MKPYEKHCAGTGCDPKYRDACALHSTDLAEHVGWLTPVHTGEYCDHFRIKRLEYKEERPCDVPN